MPYLYVGRGASIILKINRWALKNINEGELVMKKILFVLLFIIINTNWLKSQTIINLVIEETYILNNIPSPQGIAWDGTNFWISDNYTSSLYKLSPDLRSIDTTIILGYNDLRDLTFDGQNLVVVDNSTHRVIKINKNNPLERSVIKLPVEEFITGITWNEPNFYISFDAGWSSQVAKLEPEFDSLSFVTFTRGSVTGLSSDKNIFYYSNHNLTCTEASIDAYKPDQSDMKTYYSVIGVKFPACIEIIAGSFWILDLGNRTLCKLKVDTTLSSQKDDISKTNDILLQNYPNPFNPSTTIRFALPINARVIIKLYNALGQEVVTILNTDLDAGIHEAVFNASNLSSGVYFYMLKVQGANNSNFTSTKRMILMK